MKDQVQKTAIVTGANTGLGYETALDLYRRGMNVIVASRNPDKAREAIERMRVVAPISNGKVEFVQLNLSSLEAVESFADWANSHLERLDLLINNAGIMTPPPTRTDDGYEAQFGVNFVAHFALTGRLFALLEKTPGARVVSLSSRAHRGGVIDFANFALEKPYDPGRAYAQSKLANLIFALEFDRRIRISGHQLRSLAAHPGVSQTDLFRHIGPTPDGIKFMSAAEGAAPTVMAATLDTAQGGQYFGPDGPGEANGKPALAKIDAAAMDATVNSNLWQWAQKATGVYYP
ncbi:oxidoreductase [Parasedimentitalea psychrophila]|uniref:Oxidoreductase n=1 Tax=Parasedimentitalea psychrophila TaxID=2997337 RepID=A0A9Y2P6B5_9RHOB|nr:oxidoreductase [Parasedimentitalea psychrophila]WIY24510.1 oxidoreductase [Parasedimentitalea psychrophila]